MSAAAFQTGLARLVTDERFRGRVRERGEEALGGGLTDAERRRLLAVAGDRGLDMSVKIHRAWRLGKLYRMLPFTCALLGEERLGREVHRFWAERLPRSFYFRDEALEFCDHLARRLAGGLRVAYLDEVVAYERAALELERPLTHAGELRTRAVEFRHDPARLLSTLTAGRRPRAVPERPCVLTGTARAGAQPTWELTPAGSPAS